jgi:hypothetical protein
MRKEEKAIPKTSRKAPATDEIADMASRGDGVSSYFTNKFIVVRPKEARIHKRLPKKAD